MFTHLQRLAASSAFCALVAIAPACGDDDEGGSEFEVGGSAGTGTGGSGNVGGLAGSGGSGGSGASDAGDAAAGSGGSGGDCTTYGQGEPCASCLDQNCCAQASACENSADCSAMVECAKACPDPTDGSSQCLQDCADQHNLGGPEFNPLILCMGGSCGSVCPYL
jgi:hypothetical protein